MNTLKRMLLLVLVVSGATIANAQEKKNKGVTSFKVYQEFDLPVEILWQTVAEDYGNIINSHPAIWSSEYINGSTEGRLGAQRKLEFNRKGTKSLSETIVEWNPQDLTMQVQLDKAVGFPIDEPTTLAILTFQSQGPNKSSFQFDFSYGTNPRFLGGMIKGKFSSLITDYMIALEHYIITGEQVNAKLGNFKTVKKAYKKRQQQAESNTAIALNK